MTDKKIVKKYLGKWVLVDIKTDKILFASDDISEVIEKGWEFPDNKVIIDKMIAPGTCFF